MKPNTAIQSTHQARAWSRARRAVAVCFAIFIAACTQGSTSPSLIAASAPDGGNDKPAGVINEVLAEQSGEERLIYHVGPVDIPALAEADAGDPITLNFHVSKPLWVIGFEPRMVNAEGEEVDGKLLHSAIVSNQHEENPLCTSSNVGNPFIVSTSTMKKIQFPRGYGYPVLPTDPLEARVVVQNPTDASYINVYFELTLITKPMNEFVQMKDIKPMLFDVDACNHKPISVEPNNISRTQATYLLAQAYKLVVATGALQSYGICVDLTANKEVLPFWTAESVFDDMSNIIDLRNDPFEDPAGVPFKKGDSLTLSVVYDNTSGAWLEDATAAAMVYFSPKDD